MRGQATIGRLSGKAACLLAMGALLTFSLRFQWHPVVLENGVSGILSNPSELGFYLLLGALVCRTLWVVLEAVRKEKGLAGREPNAK